MSKASETRFNILQKAFELIYVKGYQATSIDDIIANTKVTKGAFFYHFKNKEEMGLAVINEIMFPLSNEKSFTSLEQSTNPVRDIYGLIKYLLLDHPFIQMKYGCPAANLTQEMSPINDDFSIALAKLVSRWHKAIEANINSGKKAGMIKSNTSGQQVAYFVMSGYWGIRNFGKLQSNEDCYIFYLKELKKYLKTLEQ